MKISRQRAVNLIPMHYNLVDKFLQRKPRRGPPNRKPVNFNFVNTIGWQSSALHV